MTYLLNLYRWIDEADTLRYRSLVTLAFKDLTDTQFCKIVAIIEGL